MAEASAPTTWPKSRPRGEWSFEKEDVLPMIAVRFLGLGRVVELSPPKFTDPRGFVSETWSRRTMEAAGFDLSFVQDNHSYSADPGVLRGLHYQVAPAAQGKLVRVPRGAAFDVAVDIRRESPDFGKWVGLTLSAQAWNQIYIPEGYAHGFVTLEAHTEVVYKVTAAYDPDLERAIRFDDPSLAIDWPLAPKDMILSDKDRAAPFLPVRSG